MVHAVNKDYPGMAEDFIKLGFLAKGELELIAGPPAGGGERRVSWTMRPLAELPAFSISSRGNGGRLYQAGLPGQGRTVAPLAASASDQGP